jgi:ATP-dependent DNA helicase RecG
MDLLQSLKSPEGKTLEFKRDFPSPNGILRRIVAFANTSGGVLLIGVEDGARHVRGISDPTEIEELLRYARGEAFDEQAMPELNTVCEANSLGAAERISICMCATAESSSPTN